MSLNTGDKKDLLTTCRIIEQKRLTVKTLEEEIIALKRDARLITRRTGQDAVMKLSHVMGDVVVTYVVAPQGDTSVDVHCAQTELVVQ